MTLQSIRDKTRPSKGLIIVLVIIALASGGLYATQTSFELYNEISLETTLYDVGADGDNILTLDNMYRVYTDLKVVVQATHTNGLDRVNAYLYDEEKTSILQSGQMVSIGYDKFELTFNVDGYAYGYYLVVVKGIPSTHAVSVPNPDYADWEAWMDWWNALSETDQLSWYEIWKETGGGIPRQPAEYLTEMKSDVFINNPEDFRLWIENPAQDMVFSLTAYVDGAVFPSGGTTKSTVTFAFAVTEGVKMYAEFAIYDSENTRVADVDANYLADFEFNVNEGQADGVYTAQVFVIGTRGWTGGYKYVTINIDNPDPLSGIARVYTVSESGWQEVTDGGTLKGDILVEVEVLSGTPSWCVAILNGPAGAVSHAMEFDGTYWSIILNTRSLVNGMYSLSIEMTRDEDGAKCYLSVFDVDITGGLSSTLLMLILIGVVIAALLVVVGRMSSIRQNFGKISVRLRL